MAITKDWTAESGDIRTVYFAGGDASSWCVHSMPAWARVVTVTNRGATALYIQWPGVAGAATVTDHAASIASGETHSYYPGSTAKAIVTTFGTFGSDGATHAMSITFEGRS